VVVVCAFPTAKSIVGQPQLQCETTCKLSTWSAYFFASGLPCVINHSMSVRSSELTSLLSGIVHAPADGVSARESRCLWRMRSVLLIRFVIFENSDIPEKFAPSAQANQQRQAAANPASFRNPDFAGLGAVISASR
jgi:hypothetical protein